MKAAGTLKEWKCLQCKEHITSKNDEEQKQNVNKPTVSNLNELQLFISEKFEMMTNEIINNFNNQIKSLKTENELLHLEINVLKSMLPQQLYEQPTKENLQSKTKMKHQPPLQGKKSVTQNIIPQSSNVADKNKNCEKSLLTEERKESIPVPENTAKNNKNVNVNVTDDDFRVVTYKKRTSNYIGGTAKNLSIKGAEKLAHMHLYGLSVDTTADDLIKHLNAQNILNTKCEALISKRPDEYTSYKISCKMEDLEKLKNPEIWPEGVRLNRFLFNISQKRIKAT